MHNEYLFNARDEFDRFEKHYVYTSGKGLAVASRPDCHWEMQITEGANETAIEIETDTEDQHGNQLKSWLDKKVFCKVNDLVNKKKKQYSMPMVI